MSSSGPATKTLFFPREHGATAMLFTPILCAAILARQWHWATLAVVTAAFAAMAAKDPLVILLRQHFLWKQPRPETPIAAKWFAGWMLVLAASAALLITRWPLRVTIFFGIGIAAFAALALWVNIKNKQRSTLFQILSGAALTSSCLATSLAATGSVQRWCWWLWLLLAMNAATGILVVHSRLDAVIALKRNQPAETTFRRAAFIAIGVLLLAAILFAVQHLWLISLALSVALLGYARELRRQRSADDLKISFTHVGQRSLLEASIFAILLILALWTQPNL